MNRRLERLGDLLPGVLADLVATHTAVNGEPPMTATKGAWLAGLGAHRAHYFVAAGRRSVCGVLERKSGRTVARASLGRCLTCTRELAKAGMTFAVTDPLTPAERTLSDLLMQEMRKWPYVPSDLVLRERADVIVQALRDHHSAVQALLAEAGAA